MKTCSQDLKYVGIEVYNKEKIHWNIQLELQIYIQ